MKEVLTEMEPGDVNFQKLSHPVLRIEPDIHYMWNKEVKSHI
jgi:hypothetical protein